MSKISLNLGGWTSPKWKDTEGNKNGMSGEKENTSSSTSPSPSAHTHLRDAPKSATEDVAVKLQHSPHVLA